MGTVWVPYHLDEYLSELDIPLRPDVVVSPDLPAGDVWSRLAALYAEVAGTVADEARWPWPGSASGGSTAAGSPDSQRLLA